MWDILTTRNIMRIVEDPTDIRQAPGGYTWINRVPVVDAEDDEVMGSWEGRVVAADIIADDAKAIVRAAPGFTLRQTKIPNLKHGELVNQKQLKTLQRIESGNASRGDLGLFGNYLGERTGDLVDGVWARMEALTCAMLIDAFNYDRLGIKITGGTWGMPSDLKVTTAVTWTTANAATAKPVSDLLTVKRIALQKYGVILDRATISTTVALALPTIQEFKDFATLNMQINLPGSGFNAQAVQDTAQILGRIVGMTIEIDDSQFWTEDEAGTETANRYIPESKVIMTSTQNDGQARVFDFANAQVTETIDGIVPNMIGSFSDVNGPQSGPVGYVTAADPNGNPPGLIMWAVGAGFPRRHKKAASAVLTVL